MTQVRLLQQAFHSLSLDSVWVARVPAAEPTQNIARPNMPIAVGLLMDHDARGRQVLADGLRRRGMQIIEACTATEAFELAQFGRLQFVVANSDTHADAINLCRELRASTATAALLILLLSSEAGQAEAVATAGANMLMATPVSAEAVAATINRMLPNLGNDTFDGHPL